ncbi:hypothetical protein QQF64_013122 [Cirrhinus molitorella]|uniref:Secreted protein n=1 Tax=Cirrhinus molitorella TaxID=172907 RepID=A0ABR3LSI7_9TELE
MPDPLFSLSFHGLFLFPLTPCNSLSLSPVCPLPPPPSLSLSGCRVSFFQPHGAAHAKRGREGRRARVATPTRHLCRGWRHCGVAAETANAVRSWLA